MLPNSSPTSSPNYLNAASKILKLIPKLTNEWFDNGIMRQKEDDKSEKDINKTLTNRMIVTYLQSLSHEFKFEIYIGLLSCSLSKDNNIDRVRKLSQFLDGLKLSLHGWSNEELSKELLNDLGNNDINSLSKNATKFMCTMLDCNSLVHVDLFFNKDLERIVKNNLSPDYIPINEELINNSVKGKVIYDLELYNSYDLLILVYLINNLSYKNNYIQFKNIILKNEIKINNDRSNHMSYKDNIKITIGEPYSNNQIIFENCVFKNLSITLNIATSFIDCTFNDCLIEGEYKSKIAFSIGCKSNRSIYIPSWIYNSYYLRDCIPCADMLKLKGYTQEKDVEYFIEMMANKLFVKYSINVFQIGSIFYPLLEDSCPFTLQSLSELKRDAKILIIYLKGRSNKFSWYSFQDFITYITSKYRDLQLLRFYDPTTRIPIVFPNLLDNDAQVEDCFNAVDLCWLRKYIKNKENSL